MKVCVVGIGYVGLVSAGCLAEAGNDVVCVDIDEKKIAALKEGVIPIYEPGLTEIVQRNEKLGRLVFTMDLKAGVENSLIIFLAVGTPSAADGSADISAILEVSGSIAELLEDYRIIVTKSTVPVGTYKKVTDLMSAKTEVKFDYVSNPEFLKEGSAVEDFMRPDRIIIGTKNPAVRELMKQLYGPFMRRSNRIVFMDPISAEMTKYAANTMLATRITLMNEISELCEQLGADVEHVRHGIGSDSRIGQSFLFPGIGFGGSCFPKDIRALIYSGTECGVEMSLAKMVQEANAKSQDRFARKVMDYFSGSDGKPVLAVWGLAFKAKTDDVRESPAINCVKRLLDNGMTIRAYDPEASKSGSAALDGKIEIFDNGYDALDGADALIILTDWQEFRNPNFESICRRLKKPLIFDGRNLYDLGVVKKFGIEYYSIGRAAVLP
jgi:UDPglucose 6-dehydrogenase